MGMESVFRLSVVMNMIDQLSSPLSDASNNVTNTTSRMNDAFGKIQKAGAVLGGIGAGITTACLATVQSTFDTQDALGELSSLGVTDLEAVENAAKNFSDTWAGTTKSDFISAAYDIKSGIASLSDEGVAQFTELAALTGKATKSTTEEMGSLFATGYGIYKGAYEDMSDLEFGEMFSAGISTAVKNYKTAGSEMASSISALGATATNNNVPLEEQLAILGQLQTTMSGSEAATKYKSFLNQAASAGEKLGVSFVDANNQLLSTPEILEKLQGKYGDTIDAVEKQQLKEAFGTDEAVAMIDLLYNDIGGLSGGIDSMAESMKQGTAVTQEMAEAIQNTPAQKFETLKQQIHNNVEELGNSLLPTVNDTLDKVSELIQKGSEWISNNKETVDTIMNIALRLGVVLIAIAGVIGIITTVVKVVNTVKTAITAVKTVWMLLNGTFLASPVGWIVLAIIGIVAAFVILWNKCEAFRNFWKTVWEGVKAVISPVVDVIKGIVALFKGDFAGACDFMSSAVDGFANVFKNGFSALLDIAGNFAEGFLNVVGGVLSLFGIDADEAIEKIKGTVSNGLEAVKGFFGNIMGAAADTAKEKLNNIKAAYEENGGGIKGVVAASQEAVKGCFTSGFTFIDNLTGGKLTSIKQKFSDNLQETVSIAKGKLDNVKSAYEANGGGIKGVVAASQEAVKGYFTSGLTFIDNLTGGKLTDIKQKFTDGMQGAASSVNEKLNSIKDKFNEKMTAAGNLVHGAIEKIKGFFNISFPTPKIKMPHINISGEFSLSPPSVPKFGIEWYAEGGVMTAPTIFGSAGGKLLGGGEAGDEAILPLSALWEKLKMFIHDEMDQDDDKNRSSAGAVISELTKKETKTLESREKTVTEKDIQEIKSGNGKGNTIIQKLEIKVEVSKLKDLPMLFKLVDEIKDAQNSTDEPATA